MIKADEALIQKSSEYGACPIDGREKIQSLEKQISTLQEKHQKLVRQRTEHLASIISKVDFHLMNEAVIAGIVLWAREKVTHNDPLKEVWREAGEKFLQKKRSLHFRPKSQTVASLEKNKTAFKSFKTSSEPREDAHEV